MGTVTAIATPDPDEPNRYGYVTQTWPLSTYATAAYGNFNWSSGTWDQSGTGDVCTCGRPWNSVTPPPPCPVHSVPTVVVPNSVPVQSQSPPDGLSELRQAIADKYAAGWLTIEQARDEVLKLYGPQTP